MCRTGPVGPSENASIRVSRILKLIIYSTKGDFRFAVEVSFVHSARNSHFGIMSRNFHEKLLQGQKSFPTNQTLSNEYLSFPISLMVIQWNTDSAVPSSLCCGTPTGSFVSNLKKEAPKETYWFGFTYDATSPGKGCVAGASTRYCMGLGDDERKEKDPISITIRMGLSGKTDKESREQ